MCHTCGMYAIHTECVSQEEGCSIHVGHMSSTWGVCHEKGCTMHVGTCHPHWCVSRGGGMYHTGGMHAMHMGYVS